MDLRDTCILTCLIAVNTAVAQPSPPVLHARSATLSIRDGGTLLEDIWTAGEIDGLEVYDAIRTGGDKTITFISDSESLSLDVSPGHTYDFVILLNDTRACPTRISTMAQSLMRAEGSADNGTLQIPITIESGKLHLRGQINNSSALDLIFDTGADICVLYPSAMGKGADLAFDGVLNNAGTGGVTLRSVSRDNRLSIADCRWQHESVLYVERQADQADGIVGYRVFEDKVVTLDFDRMLMSISDDVPAEAAGLSRCAMTRSGTLMSVEATLDDGADRSRGRFLLDTGATGTLIVNQAFATEHGLRGAMRKLGTSVVRGVGAAAIRHDYVFLPVLGIAGFELQGVPIHVEVASDSNPAPPGGALCMDVLQKFNTILDFPNQEAYFVPNSRFTLPFPTGSPSRRWIAAVIVLGASVTVAWILIRRRTASRPVRGL